MPSGMPGVEGWHDLPGPPRRCGPHSAIESTSAKPMLNPRWRDAPPHVAHTLHCAALARAMC
eukprot:13738677-Alexandrium_andersonii.AAC.1